MFHAVKKVSETEDDIGNVQAWAEIIKDVLRSIPSDKRIEVLTLATAIEETQRKEREAENGCLRWTSWSNDWMKTPRARNWNAIMRLKSLLIQVFARDITNNHSPKDAATILFAPHRCGTGSGCLADYIDDLPREGR